MLKPRHTKPVFTNVWFFSGRSIGVTLLGLHALQVAKTAAEEGQPVELFLVMTDDASIYKEMLAAYPEITIVTLRWASIFHLVTLLTAKVWQKNLFFYPPAFGNPPIMVRWFSFVLGKLFGRGEVVGFQLGDSSGGSFFFTQLLPMDLHKNIFFAVAEQVAQYLPVQIESPKFLYVPDSAFQDKLPKKYIVFHPYAANEGRTYPDSLATSLLNFLLKEYDDFEIVISGGPADYERAKRLRESAVLCQGRISLLADYGVNHYSKLAQIIAGADLFIGVDTGITHLAANVDVPTVVLGNRSNPMWLPEYSKNTSVLFNLDHCTCTPDKGGNCVTTVDGKQYYRCMIEITWQDIASAIELRLHGQH